MTASPRRITRTAAGLVALGLLFGAAALVRPGRVFYSPDEGAKYLQLRGMGGSPFRPCRILYPGEARDAARFYYPARAETVLCSSRIYPYTDPAGRVQTNWPPWFAWIARPLYLTLGMRGLYILPWLGSWLVLALAGRLAATVEPEARPWCVAALALASPLLFYSVMFWEHTPALALQLAALACALPAGARRFPPILRGLTVAALLLGAVVLRREAVFLAAALGAALAWTAGRQMSRPRPWVLILAAAACLLLFAAVPVLLPGRTAGDLWATLYRLADLRAWPQLVPHFFNVFLALREEGPLAASLYRCGQAGLLLILVNAAWPRARRPGVFCAGAWLVALPALGLALTPIRYRALHSLLLSAPWALLALLPAPAPTPRSITERRLRAVALACAAFYFAGTWPTHRAHGGLEWGSRYALALTALLTILGATAWVRWRGARGATLRVTAALLLLAGALSLARGLRELTLTRRELGRIQTALAVTSGPIVTDAWWMGASLADLFLSRELYTLAAPGELRGWLRSAGADAATLVYASYTPLPGIAVEREQGRLVPEGAEVVCGMTLARYRVAAPAASDRTRAYSGASTARGANARTEATHAAGE